ncbi:MAG: kelch repeat-containing protein [Patescibacteria group bacterium]
MIYVPPVFAKCVSLVATAKQRVVLRKSFYIALLLGTLFFFSVLSARAILVAWIQKFPINSPQIGYYSAMVYDSDRAKTVLFGGTASDFVSSNETWTWDGENWTKQSPVNIPPARVATTMAYDKARGQVVMFGGGGGTVYSDTWVWDGVNWYEKNVTGPQARVHASMAYDAARGQVVLFGGSVGSPSPLGDTWVWDGITWTQKFPTTIPPVRSHARMVYDEVRQQTVLFGGWNGTTYANDTWVWDGNNWTQKFSTNAPPPRTDYGLAYNAHTQRVVLFGGILFPSNPVDNATWEWDGANWMQVVTTSSPSGRGGLAMTYDAARNQIVLFGGVSTTEIFTETWVLGSPIISAVIDIKPGSYPNSINLGSNGVIPVAILGSSTLDVTQIKLIAVTLANAPVRFRSNGQPMASYSDINGDGFTDITVHFSTNDLQLSQGDVQADLTGELIDGTLIEGSDSVRIVP